MCIRDRRKWLYILRKWTAKGVIVWQYWKWSIAISNQNIQIYSFSRRAYFSKEYVKKFNYAHLKIPIKRTLEIECSTSGRGAWAFQVPVARQWGREMSVPRPCKTDAFHPLGSIAVYKVARGVILELKIGAMWSALKSTSHQTFAFQCF